MLCVCVVDVMDVVFSVCIVRRGGCSCMGSVSVLSCRCCMFVSCVHSVAVLNTAFCMTCSLLMLVEDGRGDHMEEAYSRAGLMTALYVVMSVSFCLHHPVVVVGLPTPLTLVCGGRPIIPLLVHQPAYLSILPAAPSLQWGLSTNPGVTVWCICGCS